MDRNRQKLKSHRSKQRKRHARQAAALLKERRRRQTRRAQKRAMLARHEEKKAFAGTHSAGPREEAKVHGDGVPLGPTQFDMAPAPVESLMSKVAHVFRGQDR